MRASFFLNQHQSPNLLPCDNEENVYDHDSSAVNEPPKPSYSNVNFKFTSHGEQVQSAKEGR